MTTIDTALKLDATYATTDVTVPQGIKVTMVLATKADAQAFVAQFPKSLKLHASTLHTSDRETFGYVVFDAWLVAGNVNGGVNEAGLARFRSLLKHAARLGIELVWAPRFGNSYPTREAFEAALAAAATK